jgi:hypothetical protein
MGRSSLSMKLSVRLVQLTTVSSLAKVSVLTIEASYRVGSVVGIALCGVAYGDPLGRGREKLVGDPLDELYACNGFVTGELDG